MNFVIQALNAVLNSIYSIMLTLVIALLVFIIIIWLVPSLSMWWLVISLVGWPLGTIVETSHVIKSNDFLRELTRKR